MTETNSLDTDIASVEEGYVSITPVVVDLTDYDCLHILRSWKRKLTCNFLLVKYGWRGSR